MRTIMLLTIASAGLMSSTGQDPAAGPCDMAGVVKGWFCAEDATPLLREDLVSAVTYFLCESCESIRGEAGECGLCGTDRVEMSSGDEVCPACFEKPTPEELCSKAYFECPDCLDFSAEAGVCGDCEVALEEHVSLARLRFVCRGCKSSSRTPGRCKKKTCELFGEERVRKCSRSGHFPHVKARAKRA